MQSDGHFFVGLLIFAAIGVVAIFAWQWITTMIAQKKANKAKRIVQTVAQTMSEQPASSTEVFVPVNLPTADIAQPTSSDAIISTSALRKTFTSKGKKGTVEAVRGVSFDVQRGEVFGLLGPNGAGKTTTMRMLCTLLLPTSGSAVVAGYDLEKGQIDIRTRIGYVSQAGGMQRETTGRENLMLQAKLYGLEGYDAYARTKEILQLLNIEEYADRKTVTYSGGQRRMFDLACGIVHKPDILFLDEPSTGLDPQNRAHVWEQVKKLQSQGTTIIVTTHYLDEADALCDRVAIVDKGQIVALGSPDELKRQIGGDAIVLGFRSTEEKDKAATLFTNTPSVREVVQIDDMIHLYVERGDEELPHILSMLHTEGMQAKTITLARPSLDDVFLKITGRTFETA